MFRVPFRVMQPWGPHKGRQATLISEHHTVAAAFAEIDRLSAEMVRTRAPSDAIELSGSNWECLGTLNPLSNSSYNQAQLRWP